MKNQNITSIILAGGQGRRFDHQDKGLVVWQGKSFIQHVINRLSPQTAQTIISCNRNLEQYRSLGFPVIEDKRKGFQGPLAGIEAAIEHCNTRYAMIAPCDSPILPENLVDLLYQAINANNAEMALVHDGSREQYLIALWDLEKCHVKLQNYLDSGGQTVKKWYDCCETVCVDLSSNAELLVNINSQQELDYLTTKFLSHKKTPEP